LSIAPVIQLFKIKVEPDFFVERERETSSCILHSSGSLIVIFGVLRAFCRIDMDMDFILIALDVTQNTCGYGSLGKMLRQFGIFPIFTFLI
jgi:hypothetical protein